MKTRVLIGIEKCEVVPVTVVDGGLIPEGKIHNKLTKVLQTSYDRRYSIVLLKCNVRFLFPKIDS